MATDVDAILRSGRYRDRRGVWRAGVMADGRWGRLDSRGHLIGAVITRDQMRNLIERDLHRGECPGLRDTHYHPALRVLSHDGTWTVHDQDCWPIADHPSFAAAMDAARHMTGETP